MHVTTCSLKKSLTDAEQNLWRPIRKPQLTGVTFRRQPPIGTYIVAVVGFEKRLVIEPDGGHHAVNQDYDHCRSEWLRAQGFTLLRFWNHGVMNRIEEIKEGIVRHVLTPHPDLPPQGGKEMNGYHAPVSSVGKDHPVYQGGRKRFPFLSLSKSNIRAINAGSIRVALSDST